MSENLSNFLVDLASDPDRMASFLMDPGALLDRARLTADEKAAVLSQDPRRLSDMFAEDNGPEPIIEELNELELPATREAPAATPPPARRRTPARRKPAKRAPAKRKAPSKRKKAPAKRKSPAKRKAPARKKGGRPARKKK